MTGDGFKTIREHLQLSQAGLGLLLKVDRRTIWAWETNRVAVPHPVKLVMQQWKKSGVAG
jgi:DNA-binding transcriptional regulator YiaG